MSNTDAHLTALPTRKNRSQLPLMIYCPAGFPRRDDTVTIVKLLYEFGINSVEIGFPFSDPVADGPVLQMAQSRAIRNGMTLELLLQQLTEGELEIGSCQSLTLMGYLNPVLQFGVGRFLLALRECGVTSVVLPDLPLTEYLSSFRNIFQSNRIEPVFLITPRTRLERVREIDQASNSFIYVVATDGVTGGVNSGLGDDRIKLLARLIEARLRNPLHCGFGIANRHSMEAVQNLGAVPIIGSAFVRALEPLLELAATAAGRPKQTDPDRLRQTIGEFVTSLTGSSETKVVTGPFAGAAR